MSPASSASSLRAAASSHWAQKSFQSWSTSSTKVSRGVSRAASESSCSTKPRRQPRGKMTRPASGLSTPASRRSRVDLPVPLGPHTQSRTPESTSSEKLLKMSRPPKDLESSWIVIFTDDPRGDSPPRLLACPPPGLPAGQSPVRGRGGCCRTASRPGGLRGTCPDSSWARA